ncbi:hypothetical protein V6N13_080728 [Hibiscus sabdariffa]|uniref:TF-B3 domain-containing protein n=1 Tax=Hibiscus sabdariffa TaxID=183260 RepID=A0ABR2CB24_9ROSI
MGAQSKERLFSKKLKVTDIEKRLAIPTKILSSLPGFNGGHAVHIQLVHDTKPWPIVCTVRRQGYSKPVFSVGWRKFVAGNNLKVGDRITMYKVQDEDGRSSHYRLELEMEQPATSNQGRTASPALFDETELGNEQGQLPESADESIKQERANVAADILVDDVHVIAKLQPAKMFGSNTSDVANTKAHLDTETKCFGGIMKDTGYGYGTIHQLAEAGETWCNTVTEQSHSSDSVLGQSTPHAEQMNLDLTLAPPNS